jgi:hypothetical protein
VRGVCERCVGYRRLLMEWEVVPAVAAFLWMRMLSWLICFGPAGWICAWNLVAAAVCRGQSEVHLLDYVYQDAELKLYNYIVTHLRSIC